MGGDGDVLGLCHRRYFTHLGDAGSSVEIGDDVGHDVVGELSVDDRSEVPTGASDAQVG